MKYKIFWILIILTGIFLRLYKLGSLPNSYSPDELAQGYSAYSILTTSKDEWGSKNLLYLRSFGDFKLPFQTWMMIPSIKIFGLNTFAVRFPNAFISILGLISIYFLSKKLFPNNRLLPLITFGLYSISPWAFPMSRIALEANMVINLFIIGLTFFYYQKYTISALILSSCLYTYHSAKVFLIPFVLLITVYKFHKNKFIFVLLFFFAITPVLMGNSETRNRTADIAIFNPTDKWSSVSDLRYTLTKNGLPDKISRILQNKVVFTSQNLVNNYLSYLSPQFLINTGPGETTYGMIPGFGVIGIFAFTGLIFLVIMIFQKKILISDNFLILIIGLFGSIIPAASAKGSFSANRVSFMLPFLIILTAFGLSHIKIKYLKYLIILICLESVYFSVMYFYSANQILAEGMLYGHQQVNQYISELKPTKIIYSRKLSEPQAYYLFFQKIDPLITQNNINPWLEYRQKNLSFLDQLGEYSINNVTFKEISIPSDLSAPNTLIVGRPEEFGNITPTKIIYYPYFSHLKPAIYLYLTNDNPKK